MNSTASCCLEDDWAYDTPADRHRAQVSERVAILSTRNFNGHERASRQSRYSRRAAPQRLSGTHRRGNKRHGI